MALKEIAVQGMTLTYSSPVSGAPPTVVTPASTKNKLEGKGVYKHNTQITIPAGVTNGSCTANGPTNANIPATAQKVKADGTLVLRKDDAVTVSGIPGTTGGGSGCTLNVTVTITNAGQTKGKAE